LLDVLFQEFKVGNLYQRKPAGVLYFCWRFIVENAVLLLYRQACFDCLQLGFVTLCQFIGQLWIPSTHYPQVLTVGQEVLLYQLPEHIFFLELLLKLYLIYSLSTAEGGRDVEQSFKVLRMPLGDQFACCA